MKIGENGASFGDGEIEGKFSYINLFFFKQMKITEKIKPSIISHSDSSNLTDKFLTENGKINPKKSKIRRFGLYVE